VLNRGAGDVAAMVDRLAASANARVLFRYTDVLQGFAARMSPEAAAALARSPAVALVEPDQEVTIAATQSGATWGIDRIDQRNRPLSGTYTYATTASNVRAYIIDTGIQTSHPQFGGRAAASYDALGGNGQDCNGHGTHVAGTVGSSSYGVAKGVLLRAVRVLNCSGSGTNSGVIAGMDWVRVNHVKPAVANMSLGGGYSSATNTAANNLAAAGVFLAVAAGNSSADACNSSPSSAANTTTVAASTSTDARASYSNYGGCVDIYAPGSSITSTWLNGGTNTISGTSMATPHVTGVAALYKATFGDASYSTIRSWLVNNATANVITGNVAGTPNRLLYKSTL
ncbi:MAG TPA: S8 family peptidase, partial [Gemmatimonadaceae bacterium]|nr:S8 family peptidase [Gemmatimonadaceae bacterium]